MICEIDYHEKIVFYQTHNKRLIKKILANKYEEFKPFIEYKKGKIYGLEIRISFKDKDFLINMMELLNVNKLFERKDYKGERYGNERA